MKFIINNKLFILIATSAISFFLWATITGFKLLKSEAGDTWKPGETKFGAANHK